MASLTELLGVINISQSEAIRYLIIADGEHLLSEALIVTKSQVQLVSPQQVSSEDIENAQLVFILDAGFDTATVSVLQSKLACKASQFQLALCHHAEHCARWYGRVDSVFDTPNGSEQRAIINCIIESIELTGMMCFDYTDVWSAFRNMQRSYYFQGAAEGENRAIQAVNNAIGTQVLNGKTALMVCYSGIQLTLDEIEMARACLEAKLPADTYVMCGHRMDPTQIDTEQFEVAIFINQ